jgi:hypothetical protein
MVIYMCGNKKIKQFIPFEHYGQPKVIADLWVKNRLGYIPKNLDDLFKEVLNLKIPKRIMVDNSKKYPEIVKFVW